MRLIGPKVSKCLFELKLEPLSNDVKLEGSKNYLSWSRRVLNASKREAGRALFRGGVC
jgi:hypothetical protein